MDRKNKIMGHLSNKEKVHELKAGNIEVEIYYSKNGKKMEECMFSILKQKIEK